MSVADVTRVRGLFEQARRTYRMSIVKDMPHGCLNETMPAATIRTSRRPPGPSCFPSSTKSTRRPRRHRAGPGQITWEFRATISTDCDFSQNERHE